METKDKMKQFFILVHNTARENAIKAVKQAPEGFVVEIKPKTRSLEQNARMWAMLDDISRQVLWHGRKLSPNDWKHMFSTSLKKMDVVPNLENNGFVVLGASTSVMSKRQMIDLHDLITAFGIENHVSWKPYGEL